MKRHKRRKHGAHLAHSGAYSNGNWPEYRYGPKKPITLAEPKSHPILRGDKRKHVVSLVMAALRDWRLSPFEHEGSCRHGLRAALCMEGHGWGRADVEAASVVAEGLHLLGAKRPTYDEGQWEYAISPDYCAACHGPIDEAESARGFRFCSPECARMAYERRSYGDIRKESSIAKSAYVMIRTDAAPAVICQHCQRPFKRMNIETHQKVGHGKFCSKACHDASMRIFADRECEQCGKTFRPSRETQRSCSKACAAKTHIKPPNRTCEQCGTAFRYYHANSNPERGRFCSAECKRLGTWKNKRVDRTCLWCGTHYVAKNPKSRCCSPKCTQKLVDIRSGRWKPKYLTPPVFDFTMRHAPTVPHLTPAVFDEVVRLAA